jgi:hypothetical protein
MIFAIVLPVLSLFATNGLASTPAWTTADLSAAAARADELVASAQECPLNTLLHAESNQLQDYIKSKNLCFTEFFLGETLYLMKLSNVIDVRNIETSPLRTLLKRQWPVWTDPIPEPSDSSRILCNQVMAYCLLSDYGGAPEAYRFWLLRNLPFFPRAEVGTIDGFLADCAPIRTKALDVALTRSLLFGLFDVDNIGKLCKSHQLFPEGLPESADVAVGELQKGEDQETERARIRETVNTLIARNSPVLDAIAARLLLGHLQLMRPGFEWHDFMITRAPSELRLTYLFVMPESDPLAKSIWEKKVDALKGAARLGVGGYGDFATLPFERDEEFKVVPASVGENDLSAALMRGVGRRWSADLDLHDSKEHMAYLDLVRTVASKDDMLYYALCAIEQYVMGVRADKSPEAERVISELLDRAVVSSDLKTVVLARLVKQRALAYGRSLNWSFVEPPTYRSGIDMVDYLYLLYAPDAKR